MVSLGQPEGWRDFCSPVRNTEAVVERAHDLNALSVEVVPVGLRDIFLETVNELEHVLVPGLA
jgi:hypothetical protein